MQDAAQSLVQALDFIPVRLCEGRDPFLLQVMTADVKQPSGVKGAYVARDEDATVNVAEQGRPGGGHDVDHLAHAATHPYHITRPRRLSVGVTHFFAAHSFMIPPVFQAVKRTKAQEDNSA